MFSQKRRVAFVVGIIEIYVEWYGNTLFIKNRPSVFDLHFSHLPCTEIII